MRIQADVPHFAVSIHHRHTTVCLPCQSPITIALGDPCLSPYLYTSPFTPADEPTQMCRCPGIYWESLSNTPGCCYPRLLPPLACLHLSFGFLVRFLISLYPVMPLHPHQRSLPFLHPSKTGNPRCVHVRWMDTTERCIPPTMPMRDGKGRSTGQMWQDESWGRDWSAWRKRGHLGQLGGYSPSP